jgi:hypothetical protein
VKEFGIILRESRITESPLIAIVFTLRFEEGFFCAKPAVEKIMKADNNNIIRTNFNGVIYTLKMQLFAEIWPLVQVRSPCLTFFNAKLR